MSIEEKRNRSEDFEGRIYPRPKRGDILTRETESAGGGTPPAPFRARDAALVLLRLLEALTADDADLKLEALYNMVKPKLEEAICGRS